MKNLIVLTLLLGTMALDCAGAIYQNYFTTNATPVVGSATNGIQISGGVGTNNILYGLTVINPAAPWPGAIEDLDGFGTNTTLYNVAVMSVDNDWPGTALSAYKLVDSFGYDRSFLTGQTTALLATNGNARFTANQTGTLIYDNNDVLRLGISRLGNVTIYDTNATAQLVVTTNGLVGNGAGLTNLSGGYSNITENGYTTSVRSNFVVNAGSANTLVVTNGNVGVGTVTPEAPLEAYGTANSPNVSGGAILEIHGSSTARMLSGFDPAFPYGFWMQNNNPNYPILLAPIGGKVGIGTTTPTNKLHVEGGISANNIVSPTNTPSNGQVLTATGTSGASAWATPTGGGSGDGFYYTNASFNGARWTNIFGSAFDLTSPDRTIFLPGTNENAYIASYGVSALSAGVFLDNDAAPLQYWVGDIGIGNFWGVGDPPTPGDANLNRVIVNDLRVTGTIDAPVWNIDTVNATDFYPTNTYTGITNGVLATGASGKPVAATGANVGALFSGGLDYLKADGTTGTGGGDSFWFTNGAAASSISNAYNVKAASVTTTANITAGVNLLVAGIAYVDTFGGYGSSWTLRNIGTTRLELDSADEAKPLALNSLSFGKVGIGLGSPNATLHITNAPSATNAFRVDTTAIANALVVQSNGTTTAHSLAVSNGITSYGTGLSQLSIGAAAATGGTNLAEFTYGSKQFAFHTNGTLYAAGSVFGAYGSLAMGTGIVTHAAGTLLFPAYSYSKVFGSIGVLTNTTFITTNAGDYRISFGSQIAGANGETLNLNLVTNDVVVNIAKLSFTASATALSETGFKEFVIALPAMCRVGLNPTNVANQAMSLQNTVFNIKGAN